MRSESLLVRLRRIAGTARRYPHESSAMLDTLLRGARTVGEAPDAAAAVHVIGDRVLVELPPAEAARWAEAVTASGWKRALRAAATLAELGVSTTTPGGSPPDDLR